MNLSQKVALNTLLLVGGRVAVALSGLVGTVVATFQSAPRPAGAAGANATTAYCPGATPV